MGPATDVPHLEIGNFGCLRYRVSRTDFEFDESLLISSQVTETALFSDTPKPSNSCPLPFSHLCNIIPFVLHCHQVLQNRGDAENPVKIGEIEVIGEIPQNRREVPKSEKSAETEQNSENPPKFAKTTAMVQSGCF